MYEMPIVGSNGGFFACWPALLAALEPAYLGTTLPAYFSAHIEADQYETMVGPALSYLYGQPGGAQAWI
jgi:hypothetical protein